MYVDSPIWIYKGQAGWCHLATDGDIEELHRMAKKIGLKAEWFQARTGLPHYDLSPAMRAKAIKAGAVAVSGMELWGRCSTNRKAASRG